MIFSGTGNVYTYVDTMSQDDISDPTTGAPGATVTGWVTAIRLAIVVSVVAALVVAAFAGHVADSTLICAVIAASSIVGWVSAESAPVPTRLRLRRR